MSNPANAISALLGGLSICHGNNSPSEAALLKDKTRSASNKANTYQAHNFTEESSKEEDKNTSIFFKATNLDTPPPPFLDDSSSINNKLPSPIKIMAPPIPI